MTVFPFNLTVWTCKNFIESDAKEQKISRKKVLFKYSLNTLNLKFLFEVNKMEEGKTIFAMQMNDAIQKRLVKYEVM